MIPSGRRRSRTGASRSRSRPAASPAAAGRPGQAGPVAARRRAARARPANDRADQLHHRQARVTGSPHRRRLRASASGSAACLRKLSCCPAVLPMPARCPDGASVPAGSRTSGPGPCGAGRAPGRDGRSDRSQPGYRGVTMSDAVIVGAVRTPVGRRKGGLAGVHPVDLSAHVLRALAERTGLRPGRWSTTWSGAASPRSASSRGTSPATPCSPPAGPSRCPAPRSTGSAARSQQALHFAAAAVALRPGRPGGRRRRGVDDPGADGLQRRTGGLAVQRPAAGPLPGRRGLRRRRAAPVQPGRRRRADRRALALLPHPARRVRAGQPREGRRRAGRRRVRRRDRPGAARRRRKFAADEGIRRDTSLAKLGELPTPFRTDGVVTAGSASQISDGAAALAVTTSRVGRRARPDARWPASTPPWSPPTTR